VPLSKDRLRLMSKDERALFFLLGSAANQILLFERLVIFSTNKKPAEEAKQKISGAQLLMLARVMIGILHEAWLLITRRFLGSPIGKELAPKLNPVGQAALAELKQHFGGSSLIAKLRNSVAFYHPTDDDMEAGFQAAANDSTWDGDWNWYFAEEVWNSFYFASDLVILHGILASVGETDLIKAQEKIMSEVRHVSGRMMNLLYALTEVFLAKYFGPEMTAEVVAKIPNAPGAFEVWLPFYVEIPPDDPMLGVE
jgi:hypothetical protein